MRHTLAASVSFGAMLIATQPVAAQDAAPVPPTTATQEAEDTGLADIIVTAQRREESIQNAPLAITAVSGEQLTARGVNSVEAIGRLTAGLQVTPSTGPYATFTVRGITQLSGNAFSDPSVAVNINGVYVASPIGMRGLFYDLERVEILKGPQGTLYGRNATAGAINVIPKRPRFEFGGEFGADIGNYDRFDFFGALNVPLSDTIALRVAGQRARRTGYFSDGTSDEDAQSARAQLLFEPSEDFSLLLTGDYSHSGGKGVGGTIRKRCTAFVPPKTGGNNGNCFAADPFTAVADLTAEYARFGFAPQSRNVFDDSYYYGLALNADLKTSLGTVTFIGGYREADVDWRSSATSWAFLAQDKPRQSSLELRLASDGDKPLQYVFGAYYLDTEVRSRQNGENAATPNFSDQFNNLTGTSYAAFTQMTYALTDTLRVTGGLRYTHERKESDSRRYVLAGLTGPDPLIPINEPTNLTPTTLIQTATWNRVNWRAGVEWDVGPRSLLYANVSTGFKAGGFFYGAGVAQGAVINGCAVDCIYEPEDVTSYVLGSKNRFLNNKLQLNIEAFYLDYRNQQVSFVKLFAIGTPPALSSILVTDNAGRSRSYGVEAELDWLVTPTTRIGSQVQYLDSKYTEFSYLTSTAGAPAATSACRISPATAGQVVVDCSGQPGLRTPRWRVLGSVEQTIPLGSGRVVAEANARYETSYQSDVAYIPETRNYATTRFDLALGYIASGERFSIKAYVDNVTDVVTITSVQANNSYARTRIPAAGPSQITGVNLAPPRTFGVRGQFKF